MFLYTKLVGMFLAITCTGFVGQYYVCAQIKSSVGWPARFMYLAEVLPVE